MKMRGFAVVGTSFFPDESTLWRSRLHEIMVEAIRSGEDMPPLPVSTSFPYEPFMATPRPPARLVISVSRFDWRPQTAPPERELVGRVARAVLAWLRSMETEFEQNLPTELVIELVFTDHRICVYEVKA